MARTSRVSVLLSATAAIALACGVGPGLSRANAATTQDVAFGSAVAQTIYLALPDLQAAEAYARQVQTPGPFFHKFLSRDEFVQRFAPSASDIAKVESALTKAGYTIVGVFPNHLAIQVTSTAGTAETTFNVQLKQMTWRGRTGMVPVGTVTVPASLSSLVRGVGGLNTLYVPHPMKAKAAIAGQSKSVAYTTNATLTGGTPGNYLPQDFAARYGVDPLYSAGIKGKGSTIGIVTLANFYPADAYNFWKGAGLTVNQNRITEVSVDGGTAIAPSDALGEGETDIDVEESGGVAPDASLRVYIAPNNTSANFIDGFEAAASENIADTVSVSWGEAELDYFAEPSQGEASETYLLDAFHDVFLEMGIQGQSMYVATGDSGAYDTVEECANTGTPSTTSPVCSAPYAVDSPAADPAVTGAGGTTTPFSDTLTSGATISATQEQAWSWNYIYQQTAAQGQPIALDELFSTGDGGGVSSYFALPYYQQGTYGITRTKPGQVLTENTGSGPVTLVTLPSGFAGRNLPDLSTDADPESGYQFLEEGEIENYYGGTSFVAPQLNGVTALLVQETGGRVGLLNNVLYGLGVAGSNDITAGDNWGYKAVTGYDNAAGIGRLDASKLAVSLLALKATGGL